MAITKIIPIRVRLDNCVNYVLNPEKTTLKTVFDYTENADKTEQCLYVTSYNCDKDNAYSEMIETQKRWNKYGKKNSVLAYHLIQAFPKGTVTPDEAHNLGNEFVQKYLSDKYEVVISTHLDKEHLHNHILFNSVSFMDGKKYRNNFKDYFVDIRGISDMVCKEHNLPVIIPKDKGKHYSEWNAQNDDKPTIRSMIRCEVDEIIKDSYTFKTFIELLQKRAYVVKYGERVKYIAVRPPGSSKFIRLKSLGENYTEENIKLRIQAQRNGIRELDNAYRKPPKRYKAKGILNNFKLKKVRGFVALYYRYMYMLGKVKKKVVPQKVSFLLRKEVIKFDRYQKQFRFLYSNNIETTTELESKLIETEAKLDDLNTQREHLHTEKKATDNEEQKNEFQEKICKINSEIRSLRKVVKIFKNIKTDALAISEKMLKSKEVETKINIKEEKQNEHKW